MNLFWLHADDQGDTHLTRLELPDMEVPGEGVERVRVLGVPANHLTIAQLGEQVPELGLHPALRRRFLVLMTGEYEITTSTGDKVRLRPGDCVFVDDVGSKGHYSDDIGGERMTLASIDVPDDWSLPPS